MSTPSFFPRAQFTGSLKWVCVFCGKVNQDTIRPGTIAVKCGSCERHIWYGMAMHIPLNAATSLPKDNIVPSWADSEYPFDTIPQKVVEAMPMAFFNAEKKIKQRGRVHVVVLYENIYAITGDDQ